MFVTDWSPNQDFYPANPAAELICLRVVAEGWTPSGLATQLARCMPLVSPDEAARAARFRRPEDRLRHLLGRAALRAVLSRQLGRPLPRDQEFSLNAWGKPGLPDPPPHAPPHAHPYPPLHFNLSHGGEEIWLAYSTAGPVGVDVEPLRAFRSADFASLFHPGEQAALAREEDGQGDGQHSALLRCWVRKEAVIKAQGQGLSLGLDSFEVRIGGAGTDWLQRPPADPAGAPAPGWTTADLPTPPGVFAAVAAMAPGLRLRLGELRWVPDREGG